MNRGALTALVIIIVILIAFVLLYQRSAFNQSGIAPTAIPTTGVGGSSGAGSSSTSLSPSQQPSTTGSVNLQNPSVTPFPTTGVTVSPTTY